MECFGSNNGVSMAGRRKAQVELTIEELDRELIARGAKIPQEDLFIFKDQWEHRHVML